MKGRKQLFWNQPRVVIWRIAIYETVLCGRGFLKPSLKCIFSRNTHRIIVNHESWFFKLFEYIRLIVLVLNKTNRSLMKDSKVSFWAGSSVRRGKDKKNPSQMDPNDPIFCSSISDKNQPRFSTNSLFLLPPNGAKRFQRWRTQTQRRWRASHVKMIL